MIPAANLLPAVRRSGKPPKNAPNTPVPKVLSLPALKLAAICSPKVVVVSSIETI